jgi:hypothetical protein
MENNVIDKRKFSKGIIYIIMVQLIMHLVIVGPISQKQEPFCLGEDVPKRDGGGIRPIDGLLLDFFLELVVSSTSLSTWAMTFWLEKVSFTSSKFWIFATWLI